MEWRGFSRCPANGAICCRFSSGSEASSSSARWKKPFSTPSIKPLTTPDSPCPEQVRVVEINAQGGLLTNRSGRYGGWFERVLGFPFRFLRRNIGCLCFHKLIPKFGFLESSKSNQSNHKGLVKKNHNRSFAYEYRVIVTMNRKDKFSQGL